MTPTITNDKKVQRGWAMYDWANSAYNLLITSTIFPAYYTAITRRPEGRDTVSFFGFSITGSVLLEYSLAAAYLIVVVLSPILSAIADSNGNKKSFMRFFTSLGAIACSLMFFFTPGRIELGIICSMLAALCYCGSLVFYNAYLPEIATPDRQDRLSAIGFSYGYVGSVLLQIICFGIIKYLDSIGYADGSLAPRLSFLLVGLWWFGFAQITFFSLPKSIKAASSPKMDFIKRGWQELGKVWSQLQTLPALKRYLLAFFFYSTGVQTVMLAAAIFGSSEVTKLVGGVYLPLEVSDLIMIILIIQLVAIGGALLMAKTAKKYGNIVVLASVVVLWIAICVAARYVHHFFEFCALAIVVGLVMGGIQSISRSTYARLMPETKDTTSFFSFYDVTEKLSIVVGMFSFGLIHQLTGNMRNSISLLIVFFTIGLLLLVWNRKANGVFLAK